MFRALMRQLHDMAFEIRYRAMLPNWAKWLRDLLIFLQLFLYTIDFCKLSNMIERKTTTLAIFNNALLFNSWMYYKVEPYRPALVLISCQLVIFSIYLKFLYNIKKGKHVGKNILFVYMMLYDFFTPLYQMNIFYRFGQQIVVLLHFFCIDNLITLSFHVLGIFFTSFLEILCAIFYRPKIFLDYSLMDKQTSATDYSFYWAKFSLVIVHIILAEYSHFFVNIAIFSIYPILIFFIIFRRISYGVHVSIIGAFFQDSPMFISPFMLIFHVYGNNKINPFAVAILFSAIYLLIVWGVKAYAHKYAYAILTESRPHSLFLPVSKAYLLRCAAETAAYVDGFDKFMLMKIKDDPEEILEIMRYLFIFKQNHPMLIQLLNSMPDVNAYYDFQFYVFRRVIKSEDNKAPQMYIDILDSLHRKFLVAMSLYWFERNLDHMFRAHYYSAVAALQHSELINYLSFLKLCYRQDYHISMSTAEIYLIGMGDPVKSMKFRRYATIVKDNPNNTIDPLFRLISQNYPLSTERYREEMKGLSDSTSDPSSKINVESTMHQLMRFHFDDNVIFRNDSTENSHMAMFVQKGDKIDDYRTITTILFLVILAIIYCKHLIGETAKMLDIIGSIGSLVLQTNEMAANLSASFLYQPIVAKVFENFQNDSMLNLTKLPNIYKEITSFSFYIGEDYNFVSKSLGYLSEYLSNEFKNNSTNLISPEKFVLDTSINIIHAMENLKSNISLLHAQEKIVVSEEKWNRYTNIGFFSICIIVSFLTHFYIRFNLSTIPKSAMEFLGSKERLCLLLFQKSLESWDLFNILFHTKTTNNSKKTKHRVSRTKNESPISLLTSQHVNLENSKLTVSFLGSDHILKPEQFALMKPYVETQKATVASSPLAMGDDTSISLSSDDESVNDEVIIPNESQTMEVIGKTIEKTKTEFPYIWNIFGLVHFLPFVIAGGIFSGNKEVLDYVHQNNNMLIDKIYLNLTKLYDIPINITQNVSKYMLYDEKKCLSVLHNISSHCRYLIADVEQIDTVNAYALTGYVAQALYDVVLFIIGMMVLVMIERQLNAGFEALFHFPLGYIEDITKPRDDPPEEKLPSTILQITIQRSNGLIISVSNSCEDILMTEPINLIGLKYDEIFPIDDNGFRNYSLKRKPKKFIESVISYDRIVRIALLDIGTGQSNLVSLTSSLASKIPQKVAKIFIENNLSPIIFKHSHVILIKFNASIYSSSVDQLFANINNLLQIYSSIFLLRCEGSVIHLFCNTPEMNITLLFLRDVISFTKSAGLGKRESYVNDVDCIVVSESIISSSIVADFEPYIDIEYSTRTKANAKAKTKTKTKIGKSAKSNLVKTVFNCPYKSIMFIKTSSRSECDIECNAISFIDIERIVENLE